jgi:prepilin-type processing-associated H-X9-DG protein
MFGPGNFDDLCDVNHFWSPHPAGANWLYADGSMRFMPYDSAPITPMLSTRSGREVIPDGYDW